MTPVSGLFEYYDENNNWVASLDYGDGTCDHIATKTWDIDVFPESFQKAVLIFQYSNNNHLNN